MKAAQRRALPSSAFAYPKTRRYPIDTPARARAALSRAAQSGTKGHYATVARAVRKRYGSSVKSVAPKTGVLHRAGYRKRSRRKRGVW